MSHIEKELLLTLYGSPILLRITESLSKGAKPIMLIGRNLGITDTYQLITASNKLKELNIIEVKENLEGRRFYQLSEIGKRIISKHKESKKNLRKAKDHLLENFWIDGWCSMRSPLNSSGKTPDIVAIKKNNCQRTVVIRCNYSLLDEIQIDSSQIEDLMVWKENGAEVFIAIAISPGLKFHFIGIDQLGAKTTYDTYMLPKEIVERASSFIECFSEKAEANN